MSRPASIELTEEFTAALDLLGPKSELRDGPAAGWMDGYLFSLSGPIYAGTNEVQRNVVAERILGLPREAKGA